MDALFKTTTKYTIKEYKKFSWKISRVIPSLIFIFLLAEVLGIAMDNIFLIIFGIVYPLLLIFIQNSRIKKVFNSNKALKDIEVKYEFYNTYFTTKDEHGNTKLEYEKLHKILETKTNFYLLIAKNQGFVLIKKNLPDGLEKFLKNIKK